MPVRIKICGITNFADALCAAQSGADYLGFILFPKSPRYVEPDTVAAILRELSVAGYTTPGIGVFVNATVTHIQDTLAKTGLRFAQIHGDEGPEVTEALSPHAFKAVRPKSAASALELGAQFHRTTHDDGPRLLVDAYDPAAYGGTGKRIDEQIAWQMAATYAHLLLAGGLSPDNVAQAIRDVQPWGVDVSSGVESAPGHKDHDAIRAFVQAARQAIASGAHPNQ